MGLEPAVQCHREQKAVSLSVSPSSGLLGFLLTLSALKLKSLAAPGQCAAWLLLAQVRWGWAWAELELSGFSPQVRSRRRPLPDPAQPCLRLLLVLPAGAGEPPRSPEP